MTVAHQPPRIARADGVNICYEIFGERSAEPMLLIMGLGAQMVLWDDAFCEQIASRGFRVIRFDNRDTGQSSRFSGGERLTQLELLGLRFLKISDRRTVPAARYGRGHNRTHGRDRDPFRAHGWRLHGGMIAQEMAIAYPQRVRSLTSIMSTTGNPDLPQPSKRAVSILTPPPPESREDYVARFRRNGKVLRAGRFPRDEALDRSRAERVFDRGLNRAGVTRQIRAVLASGSRKERLRYVRAPTLVIHGTADPLVDPKAGEDTAASIRGAKLLLVPGMGHALPIPLWPEIIDAIADHAHGASAKRGASTL